MKIATWNVNGVRARHAQLLEWIATEKPDLLCLQEIKASRTQLGPLSDIPDYVSYWHGAERGYSGVSLHVRVDAFDGVPVFTHPWFDRETRIVEAKISNLSFASVYVPNGGKDFAAKLEFLSQMGSYIAEAHARGDSTIICGDMNVARTDLDVHPSQRKPGVIGQRDDERALFERMLGAGLIDVGRALDPDNTRLFTWWPFWRNARTRNLGWRLDYILASEPVAKRATECRVRADVGSSDHAPVVATFAR